MKEKEFLKKYGKTMNIYYTLDDKGNVIIDENSMIEDIRDLREEIE